MPRDGDSRISEPSLTRWDPDGLRRIRQLPRVDRPREKLLARGAESLSDVELLAVLLGCGTKRLGVLELASRVLRETEGQPNPDVSVLRAIHGLGEAKACQVASALELGRRAPLPAGDPRPEARTLRLPLPLRGERSHRVARRDRGASRHEPGPPAGGVCRPDRRSRRVGSPRAQSPIGNARGKPRRHRAHQAPRPSRPAPRNPRPRPPDRHRRGVRVAQARGPHLTRP
jgi:hypothetical protein